MRQLVASLCAAALLAGSSNPLNAARGDTTSPPTRLELLVIEVSGCNICHLVRDRIQPVYEASPHARSVPLRYVDITTRDELTLGLNERVATVPTIVLLRDGREVDRISGYLGPENFMTAISGLLDSMAD
jgi:thioredoxin-related protein